MKKLSMDDLGRISVQEYKESRKLPLVVVLDNVRSLNNIGSVFRTCDAFRVESICLCGITATPPHRDIHKTALGAEDSVPWDYFDTTAACVEQLRKQGYGIYAVEQVDESVMLHQFQPQGPIAVIFGNEVEGVDETLLPLCDGCIEIPQYGTKHSLNISIAAGIVVWDMWRHLASSYLAEAKQ